MLHMSTAVVLAFSSPLSQPPASSVRPHSVKATVGFNGRRSTSAQMGMFDAFKNAFANQEYSGSAGDANSATKTSAKASHILVATEADCQSIKARLSSGDFSFEEAAMQFSTCDSSSRGGKLGKFGAKTMVKEFDEVVFGLADSGDKPAYPRGEVIGPVRTKFGFHLVKIETRNMPKIGYRD